MPGPLRLALALCALLALQSGGVAMSTTDLPRQAAQDALMAGPDELGQMQDWVEQAFLGAVPAPRPGRLPLQLRRQDHSALRFGRSCMETPITIGSRTFDHGLGTHADSEIALALPAGARAFAAWVGIDHNFDTQGERGSVQFIVEVDGRELLRTPTRRGPDQPLPVQVKLPPGARELVLKVWGTEDGPGWDQADWADAHLVLSDGSLHYLDDHQPDPFLEPALPFSFRYGGEPSDLAGWPRTTERRDRPAWVEYEITWTDPRTALALTAQVRSFKQYPAVDWVLHLENRGSADTPLIESLQALDALVRTPNIRRQATLHRLEGDSCGERSFLPFATALGPGQEAAMAPTGGRPSSISAFPWWNLEYADAGAIVAVGWSGQWAASFRRPEAGPTRMQAGMELTHLVLHPGERIRTPRLLLMTWQGDRGAAHNRWRRLLLHHYVPQQDGRPVALPIVSQCFDRYSWSRPEWATQAGQLAAVKFAHEVGCDTHWLDAAWFPGGFPGGVGNWTHKPQEFPAGLGPIGEACHRLGMRFVVWFEPERVAKGSEIAEQHPEFVFGGREGGLFQLSDPAARRWLTELLSRRISEYGIDVYRNDFNLDPLPYWRAADPEDRQGITEIRYVEGLYDLWDELRARHPGLLIDNCSSGGRRIDLELCTRSVPLWRSDTGCSPGHPDWNQAQSMALGLYVPLHTSCGWTPEPYDFRSSATGGAICQFDYLNPAFPLALARATLEEAKESCPFWYGDFYPLTATTASPDHWAAWQFHRPDLDAGVVLAFRREQCRYPVLQVDLGGLDPDQLYRVDLYDDSRKRVTKRLAGRALMSGWELRLPHPGTSLVIRYQGTGQPCHVGQEPRL